MTEGYMKQLVSYIKKNLSKGYTIESLKWALINQGYSRSEVNKAIKLANEELSKSAPKLKEKPIIKVEREPLLEQVAKEEKEIRKESANEKSAEKKSFWKKLKHFFGS